MMKGSESMAENPSVRLIVPKSSAGQTPDNNNIVALANNYLQTFPDLGTKGVFNVTYTGYITETEPAQALFMATNRTGEDISNFSFVFDLRADGQMIWEKTMISITEEDFGELPAETSMPLLISVPQGKEADLLKAGDENTIQLSLSQLQRLV